MCLQLWELPPIYLKQVLKGENLQNLSCRRTTELIGFELIPKQQLEAMP
jgi:hypothetical protein